MTAAQKHTHRFTGKSRLGLGISLLAMLGMLFWVATIADRSGSKLGAVLSLGAICVIVAHIYALRLKQK